MPDFRFALADQSADRILCTRQFIRTRGGLRLGFRRTIFSGFDKRSFQIQSLSYLLDLDVGLSNGSFAHSLLASNSSMRFSASSKFLVASSVIPRACLSISFA